jgi:hypothetical protein
MKSTDAYDLKSTKIISTYWHSAYIRFERREKGAARGTQWASTPNRSVQGCQMVYFQTKNPNLGKFWRALECKSVLYFMYVQLESLGYFAFVTDIG